MNEPMILDMDPVSRVKRILHADDDGLLTVKSMQDVTDRVDLNKALQNEARSGWGEGQRVASIPKVVWDELVQKGIANDNKKLKAWLNDPDNRAFRTRLGKV